LYLVSSPVAAPPRSTLFPYTTLFRSGDAVLGIGAAVGHDRRDWLADIAHDLISQNRLAARPQRRVANRGVDPADADVRGYDRVRSEEHTSELQSRSDLVCRLLLEKKK